MLCTHQILSCLQYCQTSTNRMSKGLYLWLAEKKSNSLLLMSIQIHIHISLLDLLCLFWNFGWCAHHLCMYDESRTICVPYSVNVHFYFKNGRFFHMFSFSKHTFVYADESVTNNRAHTLFAIWTNIEWNIVKLHLKWMLDRIIVR